MLTINLNKLNPRPGARLLDLGCGEGRHSHGFYDRAEFMVIAMDKALESVRTTAQGFVRYFSGPDKPSEKKGWIVVNGDCLSLPLPDSSVDAICCSEVLEHIPDYRTALEEMHRVLVPGGVLAVSVPREWPERLCWHLCPEYPKDPGGHIRIFKTGTLKSEIKAQGFCFQDGHFAHGLHTPLWWLKCLNWEKRETWLPVRLYHRMLVWDILTRPLITQILDLILTPFMGKSIVMYFKKEGN